MSTSASYQFTVTKDRALVPPKTPAVRQKHDLGEVKYMGVTERGKRGGRYHRHFTIHVEKGIDRDVLEKMWTETEGHGYVNTKRLQFNEEGLVGLGKYIGKSSIGYRAWTASRNLIDPPPKKQDERISGRKARELAKNIQDSTQFKKLYPGYLCAKAETWHNDVNGGCYLKVSMYRGDGTFIQPKQKAETEEVSAWAGSTECARSAKTTWTPGKFAIAGGKPKKRRETAHMSRNMIELPGGGYAAESEALSALAREAKRRKTSYGGCW